MSGIEGQGSGARDQGSREPAKDFKEEVKRFLSFCRTYTGISEETEETIRKNKMNNHNHSNKSFKLFIIFLAIPHSLTIVILFVTLLLLAPADVAAAENGFTRQDRERLIRLEVTLQEFKTYVDKRFEQVNDRFKDIITVMGILAAVFTAMMVGTIGFAYWDRRTMIKKAKEDAISEIEKEGRLRNLIMALREIAKTDSKIADTLRQFNLL